MDESRFQAYVGLVEQLLGCRQGQEAELLQANAELVDAGLVEVMEQVAAHLESQGGSNAGWLRGFAARLAEAIRLETAAPTEAEAASQFLLETLRLIVDNQGNPQQIYPVWAQQQAQFNPALLAALPTVATKLLSGDTERQRFIGAVFVNFGILLQQFPLGSRWLNPEIAIAAYQQSLQVMTREAMPVEWATAMMNLANAYRNRIRGERADNLEQAIAAYQQSLQVMTREAMPVEWATAMMNLADAYRNRIQGEQADNLEQSIAAHQQSLQVMTREAMPVEWAQTMNNLAIAYSDRIRGERADNLEQAIAAYQQSLQVMTRESMPVEWATSMNNLAIAYRNRIQGERADNLEQAIAAYQQSLQVRTREAMPVDWATSMMNLANAYYARIQGERADNLEQAIAAYQQSLQVRTRETMPVEWATSMNNLAIAYSDRIRGERADNIEQAIAAYQQSLQVRTREAMPVDWAQTMNNLAIAYSDRIRGERADNLEQVIAAYQQSLQVRTREAMPVDWATSMMNLANAYYARIQGERADNLEQAIAAYQQSLQVRTRETMPVDWATSMMNLANAYSDRIRGDRADNLEQAIAAYQQSLQVMTREAMPVEWATSMDNLANTYRNRIRGDRADNLEQAIAAHQQSLQVRTREAMPVDWAASMNNLAAAYAERIRGERADNLEQAIAAYQQSLQVRTREAMPVEWATSMNNLANAYSDRIQGERADNLEQAIAAHQRSLQVRTREAMPVEWAASMNNLANAYSDRIQGERADNLEQAIAAHQRSLQVRTREAMPVEWAASMNNLAAAYAERIQGERADNLEQAIATYQASLKVFAPEVLPDNCRRTARSLGNLYFGETRWKEAVFVYQRALQAAETLYQSANLLDSKAAELSATADLPRRAAYALARTGERQKAVETLEQCRARGLSESLDRDRADLTQLQQTHPDLDKEYQSIAQQLRNLESQQRDRMTSTERYKLTPEALRDSAIALRQQLTDSIQRIRQIPGYEAFLSVPTFADIKKAIQGNCPLVYLVPTSAGSLALIVTSDTIHDLWLDTFNETQLIDLLNQTWTAAYRQFQNDQQGWFDAIDTVTRQLWEPLMAPIIAHLHQHQHQQATLIPTGYLSVLPLHAAWTEAPNTPTGRRYALDDIHFTHAPNARSLTAARAILDRTQTDSILAIDNPRQDLPNSAREVNAAIAHFLQPTVLRHAEATVEKVQAQLSQAAIAHFSCHGTANLNAPLNSGLLMSDGLLTLRDIFTLNLADQGGLRLAILSACETGLAGIENADEAVSLPTGLLQAGVAAVIASLWSVSDLSTMLLLTKFYDLWREQALPPDQALRQAQIWLRDTTNEEKITEFKAFIPAFQALIPSLAATRLSPTTAQQLYDELAWEAKHERSFAHPFHWAAFNYTGV